MMTGLSTLHKNQAISTSKNLLSTGSQFEYNQTLQEAKSPLALINLFPTNNQVLSPDRRVNE